MSKIPQEAGECWNVDYLILKNLKFKPIIPVLQHSIIPIMSEANYVHLDYADRSNSFIYIGGSVGEIVHEYFGRQGNTSCFSGNNRK